jgi:Protein of unknown function (DUF3489)
LIIEWKAGIPPSEISIEDLEADFWGTLERAHKGDEMKAKTTKPAKAGKKTSVASVKSLPRKSRAAAPARKRKKRAEAVAGWEPSHPLGYSGGPPRQIAALLGVGMPEDAEPLRFDSGSPKQGQAVAWMQRPQGVLLSQLMATFGWQKHSARGFVAGVIKTKLGYTIESTKCGADRRYRIVGGGPAV